VKSDIIVIIWVWWS